MDDVVLLLHNSSCAASFSSGLVLIRIFIVARCDAQVCVLTLETGYAVEEVFR